MADDEVWKMTPAQLWALLGVAVTAFVAGWIGRSAVQTAAGQELVSRTTFEAFQEAQERLPGLQERLALLESSDIPRLLNACQDELRRATGSKEAAVFQMQSWQRRLDFCRQGRTAAAPALVGTGFQLKSGAPAFALTKGGEIAIQFLGWRGEKAVIQVSLNDPHYSQPLVAEGGSIDFRGLRWIFTATRTAPDAGRLFVRYDDFSY